MKPIGRNRRFSEALLTNTNYRASLMSDRELLRCLAVHFVMGAALGALFMVLLFAFNIKDLSYVVLTSASPIAATIALVSGVSLYFALGAAITGFTFLMDDPDGGCS